MSVLPVVVIGAGINGLVAACRLARAGLETLVLERREVVGGSAVTEEIHPGFRCPAVVHAGAAMPADLTGELRLREHGLEPIEPEIRVFAARLDGAGIALYQDPVRTARELERISAADGRRYAEFAASFAAIGRFLRPVLRLTPPSVESPSLPEAWRLLRLGKTFRDLGAKDGYRLLRWGPMAVADLAAEWFETETLRAVIAARGIHGRFAGPRSAGTSVGPLLQAALDGQALPSASTYRGSLGALSDALAASARAAGAAIRTGASVEHIRVREDRAAAVVLAGGEEIAASAVVSSTDPKATFLGLVEPTDLDPDFVHRIRNYRCVGTVAKINYALARLPAFAGAADPSLLAGRIHVGTSVDDLERAFDAAKYGELSQRPYLDVTIPSIADPQLAPVGAHVMSVHAQFAPYRLRAGNWSRRGEELVAAVERVLSDHAPDFRETVVARRVYTPLDLEERFGLTEGHVGHGEHALDQLFTMRPLLGWAQYRTPIRGLYLCGAGTHPGEGVTGLPGANAAREIVRDSRRWPSERFVL